MHQHLKAIVIGSGVAGMASAVRLAVQGFEVTVLEKNSYPGGKLNHFEKDGFYFDAGPSLFTQPQNIAALFKLANENMAEYFQYETVSLACKYFYEDGTVINAFSDPDKFAQELADKLGEDKSTVKKYLHQSARLYTDIGSVFLNYSLHKINALLKAPLAKAIGTLKWKYLFNSMNTVNKNSFLHPNTVQLFNRYATYNGSNPYKAPGMLCLIPHLEHNEGTYYPKAGMISITNALYQLALKKGVQFKFNTSVQNIIYAKNTVKAVTANGENTDADIVVSNMDVYCTYKHLLKDEIKSARLLKQERSSSALVFYWGINKIFPQLQLHNIFFSKDYKAEFDHLFQLKKLSTDPTVYINITSKREPGIHAPEGKENWFVMVNAPANRGQDW
ncbi:MAG TPA: phytoene desaturase family protein, partial [Panacibacter sp.]|nr:phytoene desaturase family protein [Panacibacter sp.]